MKNLVWTLVVQSTRWGSGRSLPRKSEDYMTKLTAGDGVDRVGVLGREALATGEGYHESRRYSRDTFPESHSQVCED